MGKFRKRPVVVEAQRFLPLEDFEDWREFRREARKVADWCRGVLRLPLNETAYIVLKTIDGNSVKLTQGNWAVRDVRGFYYPCQKDVFAETHEEIRETIEA